MLYEEKKAKNKNKITKLTKITDENEKTTRYFTVRDRKENNK